MYELTRTYRRSVANPGFVHITMTVKKYKYLKNNKYYIAIYKWDKNAEKEAFAMLRHGNASKSAAATYYQTDPEVLRVIKSNIEEDKLSSRIYENINTSTTNSVSMKVRNPILIYNLQRASNSAPSGSEKNSFEINNLIHQIQDNNGIFMQSMTLLPKHYIQYN